MLWPKKLDEPNELGEIHESSGADPRATAAQTNPGVLMGSNSMSPCGVVNCKVLVRKAIADEPYE